MLAEKRKAHQHSIKDSHLQERTSGKCLLILYKQKSSVSASKVRTIAKFCFIMLLCMLLCFMLLNLGLYFNSSIG